jgi:hypothetical protein
MGLQEGRQVTCQIYEQHASISPAVSNRGTERFPEGDCVELADYAAITLQKLFSAPFPNVPAAVGDSQMRLPSSPTPLASCKVKELVGPININMNNDCYYLRFNLSLREKTARARRPGWMKLKVIL